VARTISINRAPVLMLWAAVVAKRLGFDRDEALSLGKALAGMNAYSKGRALGLFRPKPKGVREKRAKLRGGERIQVDLLGRAIPCRRTEDGIRALKDGLPITPESTRRYLESRFGEDLGAARAAMEALAASLTPTDLAERAFGLYEKFRPEVAPGTRGWGAKGTLDLDALTRLARKRPLERR